MKDNAGTEASWPNETLVVHTSKKILRRHGFGVEVWNENIPISTLIGRGKSQRLTDSIIQELLQNSDEKKLLKINLTSAKGQDCGELKFKFSIEESHEEEEFVEEEIIEIDRELRVFPQLRIEMYDWDFGPDPDDFLGCVTLAGSELQGHCLIVHSELERQQSLKTWHDLKPMTNVKYTKNGVLAAIASIASSTDVITGRLGITITAMEPFDVLDERDAVGAAEVRRREEEARKAEEMEQAKFDMENEQEKKERLAREAAELEAAFKRAPYECADSLVESLLNATMKSLIGRHLTLYVVEARNLMAADLFGKSDPYAVVHWDGKEVGRTQVVKNTLHPVWAGRDNAKFSLPPSTSKNPELRIELFDADWISIGGQPDDFLGRVVISAYDLIDLRRTTMKNTRRSKDPHDHRTLKVDFPVDEKEEENLPSESGMKENTEKIHSSVTHFDVRIFNMEVHGLPETEFAAWLFRNKQDPYIKCKLASKEVRSSVKDGAGSDATYPGEVLSLQFPEDVLMHKPLTFEV